MLTTSSKIDRSEKLAKGHAIRKIAAILLVQMTDRQPKGDSAACLSIHVVGLHLPRALALHMSRISGIISTV